MHTYRLYRIWQNIQGETFAVLVVFSLNRECFLMNYGLVDWQCKATNMLP